MLMMMSSEGVDLYKEGTEALHSQIRVKFFFYFYIIFPRRIHKKAIPWLHIIHQVAMNTKQGIFYCTHIPHFS